MKTSFNIPSCTYNIILSKEDLDLLNTAKYVGLKVSRTPCVSSRGVIDGDNHFQSLDTKQVQNNLRFDLTKQIADMKPDDWSVQFVNIILDDKSGDGEKHEK